MFHNGYGSNFELSGKSGDVQNSSLVARSSGTALAVRPLVRESTLTNYLSDSLGGYAKTVLIAHVHPRKQHLEETLSTLQFASRMKDVKNPAPADSRVQQMISNRRDALINQLAESGSKVGRTSFYQDRAPKS